MEDRGSNDVSRLGAAELGSHGLYCSSGLDLGCPSCDRGHKCLTGAVEATSSSLSSSSRVLLRSCLSSDTAAALASTALSALRQSLQPALDTAQASYDHSVFLLSSTSSHAFSALHASDTAAAKALVTFITHDRVQETYSWLAENLPIFLLVFVVYRFQAWTQAYVLRQTDSPHAAMDFGLGSPSGSGSRKGFGAIEVQWGKEKLRVPLPPPASPLSTLKATLFNMTGVPPSHMKLISSGALLKDDLTSLETYGLVDLPPPAPTDSSTSTSSSWDFWSLLGRGDSNRKLKKIIMLGSKETSARVDDRLYERHVPVAEEPKPKVEETEEQVVARLQEIVGEKLDGVIDQVSALERWLAGGSSEVVVPAVDAVQAEEVIEAVDGSDAPSPSPPTPKPIEAPTSRTPIFLSEILLQALLKLDSFDIPSTWTDARKERKEGVRKVQGALDRVDVAKDALKARL